MSMTAPSLAHDPKSAHPLGLFLAKRLLGAFLHGFTRLEVSGQQHLPPTGPAIFTPNHVSWIDTVLVFTITPAMITSLSAEKWENTAIIGRALSHFGNAIFVRRGEIDRKALQQSLVVLNQGGILGLAPEGTRSYDGILRQGHNGAAWLASRTGATLVPIAIWGHEQVITDWRRLQRPRIHIRVGEPYTLPAEARQARSRDLDQYTDLIMRRIAALLPPERRGHYA